MFLIGTEWKGPKLINLDQNGVQWRDIVNKVMTRTCYIKVREFIDQLSNYQPLQKNLTDRRVILVHYRSAKLEKLTNNLLRNKRLIVNGELQSKRK
jgi:hypothetical protein